jgi:peptidoglycan/xylan/chitin deacetylase (PgdA/CDA1 family)
MMTLYIAAYDTESPECLAACRQIVAAHRRHKMPATFFLMGQTLEQNRAEYLDLLNDPLFEVASHTYSHTMLRFHPLCGAPVSAAKVREEVFRGKGLIEDAFQRPCVGLRPGCSFENGLKGAPEVLSLVREAGYQYVSSQAWGPDYSLPALLNRPFRYTEDGYDDLWELPCHGWHENLLKDNNKWGPRRLTLWPPAMPEAIPAGFLKTPEDEFAINKVFIDKAIAEKMPHVSLIWHPWSLYAFDPKMKMLDITFSYVHERGIPTGTYADLAAQCAEKAFSRT